MRLTKSSFSKYASCMRTGLVVGTGAEDYFDSSYGFGDSWSYLQDPESSCDLAVFPNPPSYCYPTFTMSHAGLLYHGLSTWDATERYAMYIICAADLSFRMLQLLLIVIVVVIVIVIIIIIMIIDVINVIIINVYVIIINVSLLSGPLCGVLQVCVG
jgi:hypothetical protein